MASTKTVSPADEWDVIDEGSRIRVVFDMIGDEFVGEYQGHQTIVNPNDTDETWEQYNFLGTDGELYCTNAGYALSKALDNVPVGKTVRIVYNRAVDTGKQAPMKSFQVSVKK